MKKHMGLKFGLILSVLALFMTVGCTTFKAEGLSFMPKSSNMQVLGHFHEGKTVIELFGTSGGENLFNISASAMADKVPGIIWNEVNKMGGNAAVNVEIRYYVGPLSYLLNAITFHILAPARIVIEGDVVLMDSSTASLTTEDAIKVAINNASY